MQVIAFPLTVDEKRFLYDQSKSEHFRVYDRAITYLYGVEAAMLVNADRESLPIIQGRLQGLLMAKNLLSQGMPPEPDQPARAANHRGALRKRI